MILRLASLLVLMGSLYGMVVEDHDHFVDDCGNKRWQTINNTSEAPIKVIFEFITDTVNNSSKYSVLNQVFIFENEKVLPDKTVYNLCAQKYMG